MIPHYRITTDGKDLSSAIASRFISLTLDDEAGVKSDKMELVLADSPEMIERPKKDQTFDIAIGYLDVLVDQGSFTVTAVEAKGPPSQIKVTATAVQGTKSMMSQKEESWDNKTIAEIVDTIAKRNNLIPAVATAFTKIKIIHFDQTESDAAFLTRIAEMHDATFKITMDRLVFVERGKALRVSGNELPMLYLKSYKSYDLKAAIEPLYTGVRTYWWDRGEAQRKAFLIGKEGKVYENEYNQQDEETARRVAEAKYKKITRRKRELVITIAGNQEIFAERKCTISNVRSDIDGIWLIKSVRQQINSSGFTTSITFEDLES